MPEHTWMDDYNLITKGWRLAEDAEKFSALGRLLHAANHTGRQQGENGVPVVSVPEYETPTL